MRKCEIKKIGRRSAKRKGTKAGDRNHREG